MFDIIGWKSINYSNKSLTISVKVGKVNKGIWFYFRKSTAWSKVVYQTWHSSFWLLHSNVSFSPNYIDFQALVRYHLNFRPNVIKAKGMKFY